MTNDSSYSSGRRDRYRFLVTALTGVATAGSLAATGWVAGHAAKAYEQAASAQTDTTTSATTTPASDRAAKRQPRTGRGKTQVVLRQRPTRTRVSTQYVTAPGSVGGGGTVSSGHSAPASHNPPPAPSSGS